jgi:hypothetical protein
MADEDLEVGASRSKLDLRVMIDLAARCSSLEYLGCKLGAGEWMCGADPYQGHFMHDFPGCRHDAREGFANAMRCQFPSEVCAARLHKRTIPV